MKRIFEILAIAFIGGLVSIGTYKIFEKKDYDCMSIQDKQNAKFVKLTNSSEPIRDFTYAVEKSIHAVVHIKTQILQSDNINNNIFDLFDPFRDFFNDGSGAKEHKYQLASGSGVIISDDGYIVTNNHVIKDADIIKITLNDKKEYEAKVIGTDKATDIALLKIEEKNLPFIVYGNSDNLKVGEWILAVGNPFNLTSTVTAGIVSAKGRDINVISDKFALESFIQTDAAVNMGNSGGALVNTSGELVGINSAIASNTGAYSGYSFAVPVNIVKKVVDDLLQFGTVQRAFIGVNIQNIDSKLASELGLKDIQGVYVSGIIENRAAEKAGIQQGDIIISIDGFKVNNVPELQEQVGKHRPGDEVNIIVKRNGKEKAFKTTLRNKLGETKIIKNNNDEIISILGASLEPINKEEMKKLGINHGLKITSMNGGIFRKAGIREGFIITYIDRKEIRSIDNITNILKNKNGGILIEGIYPNGLKAYYALGL